MLQRSPTLLLSICLIFYICLCNTIVFSSKVNSIKPRKSTSKSNSPSSKSTISNNDDTLLAEDVSNDQPSASEFTESDEIDEQNMPKSKAIMKQIFQNALVNVPPNLNSAMVICRSKRLLPVDIEEMRFTGAYLSIDKFILFLLPAYPEFISLLACLMDMNLLRNVQDSGALMLYAATERKHVSLTTALITRNASIAALQHPVNLRDATELNETIPYFNNPVNTTLFHTSLSSSLLVIDIVQNLLKIHGPSLKNQSNVYYRQMLGEKTTIPNMVPTKDDNNNTLIDTSIYYGGIEEASIYPRWLISMVLSMYKHLPEIEGHRITQSLIKLLENSPILNISMKLPEPNASATPAVGTPPTPNIPLISMDYKLNKNLTGNYAVLHTVDVRHARVVANGLSSLILRLLLEAPGMSYIPPNTTATTTEASDPTANTVEETIDQQLFPHRLSRVFAQDGLGRTPLHIASMMGNVAAIRILLHYVARTEITVPNSKPLSTSSSQLLIESMAKLHPHERIEKYIMTNDIQGLNALDYACIYGQDEVVDLFIFGPGQPTNLEKHIMSCSRWTGHTIHSSTGKLLKRKNSPFIPVSNIAKEELGGWNHTVTLSSTAQKGLYAANTLTSMVKQKISTACQVDTVSANITAKEFYNLYYMHNRPVVIRGLALDWLQRTTWNLTNVRKNLGKVKFLATSIPYSTAFGVGNTHDINKDKQNIYMKNDGISSYINGESKIVNKPITIEEYIMALYSCNHVHDSATAPIDPTLCSILGFTDDYSLLPSSSDSSLTSSNPLYIFDSPLVASTRGLSVTSVNVKASNELIQNIDYIPTFINYEIPKNGSKTSYRIPESQHTDANDHTYDYYSLVLNYPNNPKPQFYLGSPGTGAPMHVHKDAWNALIYGQKRWYLLPPSVSLYSTISATEWVQNLLKLREYRKNKNQGNITSIYNSFPPSFINDELDSEIIECTQEAGDVMYVPHGWGHAVLNTQTSIGVAVEFSTLFGI